MNAESQTRRLFDETSLPHLGKELDGVQSGSDQRSPKPLATSGHNTETPVQLLIRKATCGDLDQIVSIWLERQVETFESKVVPLPEQLRAFYRSHLKRQSSRFGIWIAEKGDKQRSTTAVLGWQALLPCRPQPSFEKLWAQSSTYISQVNRAQGIGRALLSFACKSAIQSGLSVVIGYIRADNAASRRIVESLGWKTVGSMPHTKESEPELLCYAYAVPAEETEASNF
jgi:L-amino acid N-acyltransferase YncA